jgi:cell wall-associated NlpC family hydrolase
MNRARLALGAFLLACSTAAAAGAAVAEESGYTAEIDESLIFAVCDEYVNVRTSADTESDTVGRLYNHNSAMVLDHVGDWYEIQSGDAHGYVKSEFFAIGEEAARIASEVAYNVAVVYPDELMIHVSPDEEAESIDVATKDQELEVVAYEGDWMKVALGDDVYGYVNAYYVGYKTYYPTAEAYDEPMAADSVEEEEVKKTTGKKKKASSASEASEEQEQAAEDVQEMPEEQAVSEPTQGEAYAQTAEEGAAAPVYAENAYMTPAYADSAYTDTAYTQTAYTDTAYTQTAYTEPTYTYETAYTEPVYTDTTYTEPVYTDTTAASSYEETYYTEPAADTSYTETSYTDTTATYTAPASSDGTAGSQIVSDASNYLGNPYVWGGTSLTTGADCSGFTQAIYAENGISIPRTAAEQAASGTSVSMDDLQAGDLLFYSDGSSISHVAIYAGDGQVIHSANEDMGVTVSNYDYDTPVSAARYW